MMKNFFPLKPLIGILRHPGRIPLLLGGVFLAIVPLPRSGYAFAAFSAKDVQVAGRVLGFLSPSLTGNVKVGIVYDPAIPASAAEEQSLTALLGGGLQVAGANLIPVPVPIANLAATPVNVYFLTANLGADAAKVGPAAMAQKILCITTDVSATQAGACAVSVQSEPSVQITVNKAAASASGISFVSAFMLMITEI